MDNGQLERCDAGRQDQVDVKDQGEGSKGNTGGYRVTESKGPYVEVYSGRNRQVTRGKERRKKEHPG